MALRFGSAAVSRKIPAPTHFGQRFDDDVRMDRQKRVYIDRVCAHQCRCDELRKIQDRQFFIEVAQCRRAIQHACAVLYCDIQQLGRQQVVGIDRGIGSHQYGIKIGEREHSRSTGGVPIIVITHLQRHARRQRLPVA